MLEGKVCIHLAEAKMAKAGKIGKTDRRTKLIRPYREVLCIGSACGRYPVCCAEVTKAKEK